MRVEYAHSWNGGGALIVRLRVDGKEYAVDVDREHAVARTGSSSVSFRIVGVGGELVQLDLGGEVLSVEGWPEGLEAPPAGVTVSGEVVELELLGRSHDSTSPSKADPLPPEARSKGSPTHPGAASVDGSVGIVPPMPGKVIEVRVRDGQRVQRGDVLLVLEAMKMRNEVVSPADGEVFGLRVRPGDNASAKETMLFVRTSS